MQQTHTAPPEDGHAGSGPEYDAWFLREVQIGLDQANAGLLISSEQVEAEAAIWRAETLRKMTDTLPCEADLDRSRQCRPSGHPQ